MEIASFRTCQKVHPISPGLMLQGMSAKQAADIHYIMADSAESDITILETVHFQISEKFEVANVHLYSKPVPARIQYLRGTPRGAHKSIRKLTFDEFI